ncbi:MAG TPA: hypothetical protein VL974_10260 [Magnetospirillum sp.]|jgi:hypothetical protein|nr:hypothetical protein [Magnetospirillum sp.]
MFAKFLLTVAVIAIVWFGFKYLQRVAELRQRAAAKRPQREDKPRFQPVENGESVQDLVKCPRCHTYRSAKLGHCGQDGCPY